jgi:hypothetical protein
VGDRKYEHLADRANCVYPSKLTHIVAIIIDAVTTGRFQSISPRQKPARYSLQ